MTTLQKIETGVVIVLVLLVAVLFSRSNGNSPVFGATSFGQGEVQNNPFLFINGFAAGNAQQFLVDGSGLLTVGAKGNALTLIGHGTCSLVSDASIAATSTGTGTCVTTGSLAGDQVFVSLSTTTTKLAAQYSLVGAVAGTDTTTVRLLNLTGTAAVPSATNGFGSTTQYTIYR